MSSKTLATVDKFTSKVPNDWVEIVEPRTKQKIYANLETGICAKDPPDGAIVSKSEDFSDHWWELYDQKTGQYYYYNPEQQKTAWTKPKESTVTNDKCSAKRLLIIPVSKLQTFKKISPDEPNIERCDVSTQTIASNLVSTGTQTISESNLVKEFNSKLRFIDLSNDSSKSSSSCTHSSSNTSKSYLNHRQVSDFDGRSVYPWLRFQQGEKGLYQRHYEGESTNQGNSSQQEVIPNHQVDGGARNEESYLNYFGLQSQKNRSPIRIKSPSKTNHKRHDDYTSSTSSFGVMKTQNNLKNNQPQKLITNNLSHYLVREARSMGIALISDDEMDDDDQDSDDECVADEDEETDIRDDLSSQKDNLNASQELGEDSSEGWKSFSDQESPNGTSQKLSQMVQKSPIHCETSGSLSFNYVMDDEKDPATGLSQQLDNRKLVENFRKSRQSSSFGLQDSLGKTYRIDANQAVQKIKTVADSYFNHDKEQERHLRQVSTLSTLPRPHKDTKTKLALSKQQDDSSGITDADYDVVEENCGYYSDSEQNQFNSSIETTNKSATKATVLGGLKVQNSNFDRNKSSRGSTFSVESFARENLTRHPKKGGLLFNRKVKWTRMISWTKSSIKQPMISSVSSDLNSDSILSFKLIQQYMGDRKVTITKKYRQLLAQSGSNEDNTKGKSLGRTSSITSNNTSHHGSASNVPHIPDRLRDELAYELINRGCAKSSLRDEIFVQMARQLTENPSQESVRWGLVLMSIALSYFSPSSKFSPFLLSFLETHPHQMAHDVCLPRLEKRLRQNWLTYCRKPADGNEISIVRLSITKWPQYCGVFGESLEHLMALQSCSPYLKTLRLPWILTTLGEKLLETGGAETEGIFRCAADHDLIAQLRLEIDCVDFRKITDAKQVHSLLSNVLDPHVIAGLLKLFFRQLYEPVFPTHLYEICLQHGQDGHMACKVFSEHLSNLNKDVVAYLIRLLQKLSENDKVSLTKMDNSNLSMVWAPNLLRAPNQDNSMLNNDSSKSGSKWSISNWNNENQTENHPQPPIATSQSMIFEQTRQEMQFIRSLIVQLDTSFIENVV